MLVCNVGPKKDSTWNQFMSITYSFCLLLISLLESEHQRMWTLHWFELGDRPQKGVASFYLFLPGLFYSHCCLSSSDLGSCLHEEMRWCMLVVTWVFNQRESERQRKALADLQCSYYRGFWREEAVVFWSAFFFFLSYFGIFLGLAVDYEELWEELCNQFSVRKCRLAFWYDFPDIQTNCSGRINVKAIWWLTQFISFLRRFNEELPSLCDFLFSTSHIKIRVIMPYLPSRRKPKETSIKMSVRNRTN